MIDEKTFKVFTYGTLRRGYANHDLLKGSKFLGEYETGPGYTKITRGLPYLLQDDTGPGCAGELYEVSLLTLKLLDRLEGSPDWYVRTLIKVYNAEKDIGTDAWVYIMPKERI
jgi:gamma-glutamylcyclotransferase (GGCT)/AIG2-like uncharacterized protein YtfP